jgi:hypothetical protein
VPHDHTENDKGWFTLLQQAIDQAQRLGALTRAEGIG